jgi:secretion/DNA translocation related CpaE-like protein
MGQMMRRRSPERAPVDARPLLVTKDSELRDEVERLCAAVELVPEVVDDPRNARHRWEHAGCVLAGDDLIPSILAAGLPARAGLVVVARSVQVATWQAAVGVRADVVVELPAERIRLTDFLSEQMRATREGAPACVIGVVGARGGVGASTTAATLGLVAATRGIPAVLVDADSDSPGIDLLVGCESVGGLRWPDLVGVHGRVGAQALRTSLPEIAGLGVLAWGADGPTRLPTGTLGAIVATAARAVEIVVVDLGRHRDTEREALLGQADVVLLVAGGDLLSAAGASRTVALLRPRCADLRMVVRERPARGVDPQLLGAAVELPVALVLRHRRSIDRAIDDGLGPPISRRDSRAVGRLLADVRGPAKP